MFPLEAAWIHLMDTNLKQGSGGLVLSFFYNLLIYFWTFLNFLTTCFCLYQAIVALSGLRKRKPLPEPYKNHRFAAVIAARNEESVIPYLIESIWMQNYPRELIDVIVVADNCDDDTASAAEKAGAIVYKRFNKAEIGKSYVLKFAFEKMAEEGIDGRYDAVCIFDADNIVDRDFIYQMNKAVCAGYNVAQGYRDMKNPSDTWISGGHSIFYWMQNRFFDYGRGNLGLSATINGTGYMVTMKHLKRIGWNITTLTEDLEFTMQSVLAGERVGWVPEAIVYDEQPLTMQQSMRQRIRWTNGYFQVSQKYLLSFLKKAAEKKDWVTSGYVCVPRVLSGDHYWGCFDHSLYADGYVPACQHGRVCNEYAYHPGLRAARLLGDRLCIAFYRKEEIQGPDEGGVDLSAV